VILICFNTFPRYKTGYNIERWFKEYVIANSLYQGCNYKFFEGPEFFFHTNFNPKEEGGF